MTSVYLTDFLYVMRVVPPDYLTNALFDFPAPGIHTADISQKEVLIQHMYYEEMTDSDTRSFIKHKKLKSPFVYLCNANAAASLQIVLSMQY